MSTARLIPETWELSGDDAWRTLRRTGRRRLLADALQRMRWSDGFSHARSLAFLVSLATIQGILALVGVASAFGGSAVSDVIVNAVEGAAPGPVAALLTQAATHAQGNGGGHHYLALILGTVGWLATATTAMGQLERGLNRLYGVEQDRPFLHKYGLAVLLAAAIALLFRWCPRRHQPAWSWLAFGSGVSLALLFAITLGLGTFFHHSRDFGETYGALAGMVALLIWALLSSMALFFGASVAAQLEGVRAQASSPQDEKKVASSEPDLAAPSSDPALSLSGGRR